MSKHKYYSYQTTSSFCNTTRQSQLSWDKQFADSALAGFRMVRFDLRGHGDSDKPTSLDAYADADQWGDDVAGIS